jgi:hypothetical protein
MFDKHDCLLLCGLHITGDANDLLSTVICDLILDSGVKVCFEA